MRPVIFVVATVLLVPFVYGFSAVPEVCAVPPDPNWGKTGYCSKVNDGKQTCCWKEPDILNPGEDVWWCQDCESNPQGGAKDCGPLYLKPSSGTTDLPQGGVLQDPSTDSGPKLPEKGGFSLGPNLKFSQANTTSSNDSSTTRTGIEYNTEGQERSYEDKTEDKESGTTTDADREQPDEDN